MVDFSGKKIIVTGASSGIGQCVAVTLSRLGAKLILAARREEKLRETLSMLEGDGHKFYCADLGMVNDIENLTTKIIEENGPVDGLVYAAGIGRARPLAQLKPEALQETFAVNYFGFVELVRQLTKKGRYNAGMRIVGISSTASLCGDSGKAAYSGSKAAMNASVRCMAQELSLKGICINTIAPGMTRTAMFDNYIRTYGTDSDSYKELLKRQYLGIVEVQSVADSVAFLMSSAAKFITGICMPVDGGYTSR